PYLEWLFLSRVGRRHVGGSHNRLSRWSVALHERESDDRRREDDRAHPAAELWTTRHRDHHRRPEGVYAAVDRVDADGAPARHGVDRRVLPREREVVQTDGGSEIE